MQDLTNAELLAYIDGEAGRELVQFIENSPALMQRVQELRRVQKLLQVRLHRAGCPESLTLAEYQQGLLHGSQALVIRAHVAGCPHCTQELAQLEQFLAPQPGLAARARVIIAQLVAGGAAGRAAPAMGLRGSGPAPSEYAAGRLQIILNIQRDVRRPEQRSLVGFLPGAELEDAPVRLFARDRLVAEAQVDDLGNFRFAELAPGLYEIHLEAGEDEIHLLDILVE